MPHSPARWSGCCSGRGFTRLPTGDLERWATEASKDDQDTIDHFEGELRRWHESRIGTDFKDEKAWKWGSNKTIKLSRGGELRMERTARTVAIDLDAFLADCGRADLIRERTTYSPIHEAVKRAVLEDGESLPGLSVVEPSLNWKAVTE